MLSLFRIQRLFSQSLNHYRVLDQRRAYREILGVGSNASSREIKQQYHQLMKSHHPDLKQTQHEELAKENDEICRIVVNAYHQLIKIHQESSRSPEKEEPESSRSKGTGQQGGWKSKFDPDYEPQPGKESDKRSRYPQTEEEKLYYSIFGKMFEEDPYMYYNEKNAHLRKMYEEKLQELRSKGNSTSRASDFSGQQSSYNWQYSEAPENKQSNWKGWVIGLSVAGVSAYLLYLALKPKKKEVKPIRNINEERIQQIIAMSSERKKLLYEKLLNSYHEQHPPMLKYPSDGDVGIVTQLLKYSIIPDILFYQANPDFYYSHEEYVQKDPPADQLLLINHVKPNTLMTMTLEAERSLHNIYVNRKDLLKQLQQTGKYEPPGIFFRFFGFNYFKIREGMPLNLANVQNQEWISLFDLYFKYYSPLLIKKNNYYEYTTSFLGGGNREAGQHTKEEFLGSVHINHRSIPRVFLRPQDKNVFMWVGGKTNKHWEEKYRGIWTNYYRRREAYW